MATESRAEFGKWRAFFWPIYRSELKKFVPMLLIFFLIAFNYNLLRASKDSLVVTARSSGAEALPFLKAPRNFKPAVNEAYGRIESPKGELGYYLVSYGTPQPWRYHVRAPSLINLSVLEDMCLGQKVADAIIILGSIDIVLGETDR